METYYQRNKEKILERVKRRYRDKKQIILDYQKEWYKKNREAKLIYLKEYRAAHTDLARDYYREWYKKNGRSRREDHSEAMLEWCQQNPEKVIIHRKLQYAIETKKVKRPEICSKCGYRGRIHAHHVNYDHFMNFVWLCASCHKKEHSLS